LKILDLGTVRAENLYSQLFEKDSIMDIEHLALRLERLAQWYTPYLSRTGLPDPTLDSHLFLRDAASKLREMAFDLSIEHCEQQAHINMKKGYDWRHWGACSGQRSTGDMRIEISSSDGEQALRQRVINSGSALWAIHPLIIGAKK
jgi:hypothetical protein